MSARKLNILFIEDDCDDLEFLRKSLTKTGRFENIFCFNNADKAMEFLDNLDIVLDLIITDLGLPVVTGTELLEAVRKIDRLSDVPVLIFTGSNYDVNIQQTRSLGANGYIIKPNKAEHFDDIASLIAGFADETTPEIFDNYVYRFGDN